MRILSKRRSWLVWVSLTFLLGNAGCSKDTATPPDTIDQTTQIREENWLVGTWDGIFSPLSPFSGTRIRVTVTGISFVQAPQRHIYEYSGVVSWDVDGSDLWSGNLETGAAAVSRMVWTDNYTNGSESVELHAVRDSSDTLDLNWSIGLRSHNTPTQLLFAWKVTRGATITEPVNFTQYVLMEKQP